MFPFVLVVGYHIASLSFREGNQSGEIDGIDDHLQIRNGDGMGEKEEEEEEEIEEEEEEEVEEEEEEEEEEKGNPEPKRSC